jgi:hypothetical protein
MNYLEDSKAVTKINAADLTTATTFTMSIDTLGFAYASIDVIFEPVLAAGTSSAVAITCNLQQSDTDSAFVNVTGFVGGTSYTIPTPANTTDTNVVRFNLDLRGRKRYLNVSATPQAASVIAASARLGKGALGPTSATEAGVKAVVSG